VTRAPVAHDPYLHDPQRWGVSLAQSAELLLPCLDAAGARSVVEIGAFAGDLTRVLVDWAAGAGARVGAVDPMPQPGLVELADAHPELELIRQTSLEALPAIPLPDAVVIDGDHNYYTVAEELRLIAERAAGAELPLLLFHDVSWPHARRDDYYDPAAIPAEYRHPLVGEDAGIVPGNPGTVPGGLPYPRSAAHEGGERNGVLTAIEDFVAARGDVRLAVVPSFFGFGVVWPLSAPYADDLARRLDPLDRNPVLERLEANRVHQLAERQRALSELWAERERRGRYEALLRRLVSSSAFGLAERLSRVRRRAGVAPGSSVLSKAEIRRALDDD
jgi:hypothetical protein